MVAYCLGLGIPFLLVAFGLGWVTGTLGFVRRHARLVAQVGGALLVVMGFLLLSGTWDHWMAWLRNTAGTSGIGANL
jgi:cytochrome c-type biogenesis protein